MLGLNDVHADSTLLAGRYTLLDHQHALRRLMPVAAAKGVQIVAAGPYSSGVLAGGRRFEYADASPEFLNFPDGSADPFSGATARAQPASEDLLHSKPRAAS